MSTTQRRLGTPPAQPVEPPALLGVREWARLEGLGRDIAYRLVDEGRVRHVRLGKRILIPRSEVEAFAERESSQPPGAP